MQSTTNSTRTFQTSSTQPKQPPRRQFKLPRVKPKLPKITGKKSVWPWLLVIVLIAVSLFLFQQYREAKDKLQHQSGASQQAAGVISRVRKLVVLPANEKPTVATVQDASKLRSQTFFANARNGDKVLIYANEKEAILYRPSTNQIVTIAPASTGVAPNQ
ncbi:MAG TPA: hypothetical protein VHB51_02405 [Candidatus Saccharimonadales bacterium]|nr:hypothetical protein [Candidatus Saccharimonadales bacterium]